MKNIILISCFLITFSTVLSQSTSFIYELKYRPNAQKQYYKDQLFYLDVYGKESIFRSQHERTSDSLIQKTGFGLGFKMNYNHQYYTQKILTENKVYRIISTPIFSDIYSIPIADLNWKVESDKLKIGNFNCQRAELLYGGRIWTAWFTQEIPLQDGPYIFHGLPGLIIKISDDRSDFNFSLVKVENKSVQISPLKPKKEITWEILRKLESDFYQDPYAEVKSRNIGYVNANEKGEKIEISMKKMTESMQKNIRDNNNVIELDQALKYDY
ncbi:GLPGLI family protein [Flavobacterium sp. B17]|uniref:GLPGLI family protein n=1 Tax=Flavobacterium sp. B17 TaxID=95618 RepID=UPI00034D3F0E|nr:GLPGLI family protein [Flavobacterium sp. B17]